MLLNELLEQDISDAVVFNRELNPLIWKNNKIKPIIRVQLLKIALEFIEFIGIDNLGIKDVTITGSLSNYNYTKHSDIDLHILVDIPNDVVLKELFDAKKGLWNEQRNIKIKGYDVELYVQNIREPHISSGVYSILKNAWIVKPKHKKIAVNDVSVKQKYQYYSREIKKAVNRNNLEKLEKIKDSIKKFRQSGLEKTGEYSTENLTFKMLRNLGDMELLINTLAKLRDEAMSLEHQE
jgi:predicted nucleotidyltransferase